MTLLIAIIGLGLLAGIGVWLDARWCESQLPRLREPGYQTIGPQWLRRRQARRQRHQ